VLAHRGHCLLWPDCEQFLDHLDQVASQPLEELALRTEQPDEAEAIRTRLERLRRDAALRRRYVTLLRAAWGQAAPTWRRLGRPMVEQRVRELRERLGRGMALADVLPETHIVRRHRRTELMTLLTEELEHGTVALSPVYFTSLGAHILDLPGLLHLSTPVEDPDPRQELAQMAEQVARKAKVLSDATRVALLADLVRRPASITELAERFDVSQPTVSMHVKLLREAELLSAAKHGSRTVYSVDRDRLQCLFDDLETALVPRA
jgi:DNA-binding transcriptional ArsR family regulator